MSGKFKGMLIRVTTLDSNGMIFILAHDLMPREDEESWFYFLRHFHIGRDPKHYCSDIILMNI